LGLGPLGASDPLADPLMGATLTGTPLGAGPLAADPLGRPMASQTLGSPMARRPAAAPAESDGPNLVLIGSIGGGVLLVLLVLVGAIVVANMSGGSTPVAANSSTPDDAVPAAPTPVPQAPAATTTAASATTPTPATPTPSVPTATSPTPAAPAGPAGAIPPMGAPATPSPGPLAPAGTPPAGTPNFGPGGAQVPTAGGGIPARGAPLAPGGFPGAQGSSAPGGSAAARSGGTAAAATKNSERMVRVISRDDPNNFVETLENVTPNPKGFAAGLPTWHGDSRAKLAGVMKIGEDTRTNIQAHYSWMHNILPFIGHQDIYEKFDLSKPLHDKANMKYGVFLVPEFLVPGNPKQRWDGYPFDHFALTHFVGMSGIEDSRNLVAGKLDRSDPRAGVFGYDRIASIAEITDGTSNTIMVIGVGELANPWVMGGGATIRGARQPYFDKLSGFASHGQNGPIAMMADGSIRLISPNIDPAVFRAMCTIHGAESVDLQPVAPPLKLD
jgi:hypothetical protein